MCSYYLYCITDCSNVAAAGQKGMEGKEVSLYTCNGYSVLYSEFEEDYAGILPENLKIHNRISQNAMNSGTVLPFRYGTIVKNLNSIDKLQCNMKIRIDDLLVSLRGKVETGIKVYGSIGQTAPSGNSMPSGSSMPALERLKAVKNMTGPVHYLYNKVKNSYDDMSRMGSLAGLSDGIFSMVEHLVCCKHITYGQKDGLLVNGAYLIDRDSFQDFRRLFLEIRESYPHYSLIFSGPWPPYSFVNIGKEGDGSG